MKEQHEGALTLPSLKEDMATHCSILAWKIPWTEKPGALLVREARAPRDVARHRAVARSVEPDVDRGIRRLGVTRQARPAVGDRSRERDVRARRLVADAAAGGGHRQIRHRAVRVRGEIQFAVADGVRRAVV